MTSGCKHACTIVLRRPNSFAVCVLGIDCDLVYSPLIGYTVAGIPSLALDGIVIDFMRRRWRYSASWLGGGWAISNFILVLTYIHFRFSDPSTIMARVNVRVRGVGRKRRRRWKKVVR